MKLCLIAVIPVMLVAGSESFEEGKRRAGELLSQHRYSEALEIAKRVNKQVPDDIATYALVTAAHISLGNYKEAEESCQWMLDLRPSDVSAMACAAELRELFGNLSGAIELWRGVYQRTAIGHKEERAGILTHIARLERIGGRKEAAGKLLNQALELAPGAVGTLRELGELRMAQRSYDEAAAAFSQSSSLFALAEAQEKAGLAEQAAKSWNEFERFALAVAEAPHNVNRELILYYAGRGRKPEESLKLARKEAGHRKDVYTLAALAKALDANGQQAEARKVMDQVIAVGVRDPKLVAQAEMIEARQQ